MNLLVCLCLRCLVQKHQQLPIKHCGAVHMLPCREQRAAIRDLGHDRDHPDGGSHTSLSDGCAFGRWTLAFTQCRPRHDDVVALNSPSSSPAPPFAQLPSSTTQPPPTSSPTQPPPTSSPPTVHRRQINPRPFCRAPVLIAHRLDPTTNCQPPPTRAEPQPSRNSFLPASALLCDSRTRPIS